MRRNILGTFESTIALLLSLLFVFVESPFAPAYSRPLTTEESDSAAVLPTMTTTYDPSVESDFCSQVLAASLHANGIDTFEELAASGINGRPAQLIAEQIRLDAAALGLSPDTVLTEAERSFVVEWRPRIDAYLEGSPLQGKGSYFALSGYRHGVDPRLSPAIAMKESNLGRKCFRPHNAWGMIGRSFSSWEDGIDANNSLIVKLGGSLCLSLARRYCPPTAGHWHAGVSAQMGTM